MLRIASFPTPLLLWRSNDSLPTCFPAQTTCKHAGSATISACRFQPSSYYRALCFASLANLCLTVGGNLSTYYFSFRPCLLPAWDGQHANSYFPRFSYHLLLHVLPSKLYHYYSIVGPSTIYVNKFSQMNMFQIIILVLACLTVTYVLALRVWHPISHILLCVLPHAHTVLCLPSEHRKGRLGQGHLVILLDSIPACNPF